MARGDGGRLQTLRGYTGQGNASKGFYIHLPPAPAQDDDTMAEGEDLQPGEEDLSDEDMASDDEEENEKEEEEEEEDLAAANKATITILSQV
ncbi:hypothetical protein G7046_g6191 [Stylonectria norvegica]|nr:hypothetical protein G7046_g6191 [Stylonectria norvegica]